MSTLGLMLLLFIGIGTSVNALNLNQQRLQPPPFFDGDHAIQAQGSAADICNECEQILAELKKLVNNPELEKMVVGALKQICNLLKPIKTQCLTRVDYLVNILHELQALLENPRKTCESLSLCKEDSASILAALSFFSDITSELSQGKTTECKVCKLVLEKSRALLDSPAVLDTLKSFLTQSCNIISDPSKHAQCTSSMEELFDMVLPVIQGMLDNPEGTCIAFHQCEPAFASLISEVPQPHPHMDRFLQTVSSSPALFKIDLKCTACKTAVATFLKLLKTDKVAGGLAKDITIIVCNVFPKVLRSECFDFLGIYGKTAIVLTASEWTPTEICQGMKACKKESFAEIATNGPVTCSACNAVTSILAYELQQPELQQEIISRLVGICKVLPDKTNSLRCQTLMENFFPYILTDIFALSLVPEICPALHMCP